MIVRIFESVDYIPGPGRVESYSFEGDAPAGAREVGHIDTGSTPAKLETDNDGITLLKLDDDPEGYTAGMLYCNAAHQYGIYFRGYKPAARKA